MPAALVSADGQINLAGCRRLILFATGRVAEFDRVVEISDVRSGPGADLQRRGSGILIWVRA